MTKRLIPTVVLAGFCAACGGSAPSTSDTPAAGGETAAAPATPAEPARPPVAAVRELTIPDGTALRLDLVTPLSSKTSAVEDVVTATLREAVKVDGATVLPAGAELTGNVTEAEGSARVKGRARLAYRFTSIRTGNERRAIETAPIVHEAAATKKEDATKIGIGAGIGAAIGAIAGGGSGAAKGAAIGGAGGTGVVLATKGKEVVLGAGANVTARLTAPLTVQVPG